MVRAGASCAAVALLCLAGCTTIEHKPLGFAPPVTAADASAQGLGRPAHRPFRPQLQQQQAPRKIAIFFDGTANDEGSDTNVKRLHSLVTLQNRGEIASLYVHGVGVNLDLTGGATGGGINARVRIAYEFILNHYRHPKPGQPADEIYIFGFSRGAFAARILTSMLHNVGVVRDVAHDQVDRDPLVRTRTRTEVTHAVHALAVPAAQLPEDAVPGGRRQRVQAKLADLHLRADNPHQPGPAQPVPVQVLGLWDTVEALGAPSWPKRIAHKWRIRQLDVDVDEPNTRYGDTLCNVERAYQAVSIDDNRAWIFTPLLITRQHLFKDCDAARGLPPSRMHAAGGGRLQPERLQEVWFSGAHSDVGGGYHESGLSGVSLNWMIGLLDPTGLLPPGSEVRADPFGTSHDPETPGWLYHAINRDVLHYALDEKTLQAWRGRLCVHPSVSLRRQRLPAHPHENRQWNWQGPATLLTSEAPNPLDYGWPWRVVVQPGESASAIRSVQVQTWPDCSSVP